MTLPVADGVADRIRAAIADGEKARLVIANELWKLSDTGMTQSEIAAWCAEEGFVTLNRTTVSRLISHAQTVAVLNVPTDTNEWTLRPLSQALNKPKNPLPLEQAQKVAEGIAADPRPTAEKVAEAVRATPHARSILREKKIAAQSLNAPRGYDPEDPATAFAECQILVGEVVGAARTAMRAEMSLHLLKKSQIESLANAVRQASIDLITHLEEGITEC